MGSSDAADSLFEAPARPVTQDGTPKALGCGEAETGDVWASLTIIFPRPSLQHERRRNKARSFPHMQEFGTGL